MPEFLSPELLALRDRATALASGPLVALRDDTKLDAGARSAKIREASKAAGVYGLTQ